MTVEVASVVNGFLADFLVVAFYGVTGPSLSFVGNEAAGGIFGTCPSSFSHEAAHGNCRDVLWC